MTGICPTPVNAEGTTYNDNADLSQSPPTPVAQHPSTPVDGVDAPIGIPPKCNQGGENSVGTPTDPDSVVDCWCLCWAGDWETGKTYTQGEEQRHVVCHNDVFYQCITDHTSAASSEPGVGASWETHWKSYGSQGPAGLNGVSFDWAGFWNTSVDYTTGDINAQTNYSVVSAYAHTGDPDWATSTAYAVNDEVYSGDTHYTCISAHTSSASDEPGVGASWATYWVATDVSTLPVSSFVCIQNHNSSTSGTKPVFGANWTLYWETIVVGGGQVGFEGLIFRETWANGETYLINDVVEHENSSYVCIQAHTAIAESDDENNPGNEPSLSLIEKEAGIIQKAFDKVVNWFKRDYNDPTAYWKLMSKGEQEEKGFLGGIYDWIAEKTQLPRAVIDIIGGAAIGYGINYVANRANEVDVKEYEARFDGDFGYATSFTNPGLKDIIEDICLEAGVNYDVTALTNDTKVGFAVNKITDYESILDTLTTAFQIDMISTFDSGSRVIKFRPRSTSSVMTIPLSDLGFSGSLSGEAPYTVRRIQGNDLPRSVEITYFSDAFSEKVLTQSAVMRTYPQGQNFRLEFPISMDDAYARDLCDVILMNAHLERNEYSFTTTLAYLELEAGDVVTLEGVGDVRITHVQTFDNEDGLLQFSAVDSGITTSYKGSISGPVGTGPQPSTPDVQESMKVLTQSQAIPLDLPAIHANDKDVRMHFAVYGVDQDVSWPGARVYISKDGGTNYTKVATVYDQSSWGLVETAILPPNNFNQVDEVNTITVQMKSGTLTSAPDDLSFFNGVNKCMVGQELIYYKTVVDNGGGEYVLSDLLRGRRGTDIYMTSHVDDEAFIVIDDNLVEVELLPLDFRTTLKFKIQTIGLDPDTATAYNFTPNFMNYKGWTVANGVIDRDLTNNAYAGFWTRRYKWDPEMVNGRGSLSDEDMAGYKIMILDPSDNSIVRELFATAPQFAYTEAQQIEDFGSVQTQLKVSVVVMSKTIGPGHPTIITYGI